jgi:hypothetical protein
MVVDMYQEREGGTMNRRSGAFGLLWTNRKQHTLASDGILELVVGLLALTLAVVVIVVVMPLADHEVRPGITAGVEAGSARWSALGELCAADNEGSSGAGLAQATGPDEAFVRSVALTGQNSVGYAAAGPCSAPFGTLSMGPTEAEAYARSPAQGAAQATGPDEAFVRSVALTGQNSVGYAAAGPCSAPFGTLSMGPTEAEAYSRSPAQGAAQAVEPDEAFIRSVALMGQNSVGYAAAGPCSAPFGTLSMGPTEAEAYARSLAQTGQDSVGLVGGQ